MTEKRTTTKYVDLTVSLVFVGSYYDSDEVAGAAEGWIDSALNDRDDLAGWTVRKQSVRQVPGDPEGLRS